jgi:hypothetical protein
MNRICRLKQCLLFGVSILFLNCSGPREISTAVTGGDKDLNGCIPSAGYVWSELKKDCIRSFELDIQLREIEDIESKYIRQIGVLFSHDGKSCEIFLSDKPMILRLLNNSKDNAVFAKEKFILRKVTDKWHLLVNDTIRFIELAH